MIVKTWSLFAYIPWKFLFTFAYRKKLIYKFNRFLGGSNVRYRSEISVFVLNIFSRNKNPRKLLVCCNLNIRIRFVVFKHYVIFRTMFLYKITFQKKGFHFRIGYNVLKICNMRYHSRDFRRFILTVLKILSDPVFQINGFAYIYYFI